MNLNKHFKRNKNSINFNFKIIVIGENQEDNLVSKLIGEGYFLQELNYIADLKLVIKHKEPKIFYY